MIITDALIQRHFTQRGVDPYDGVKFNPRDAVITDASGKAFFEQWNVSFPENWSQNAINITASKYFKGKMGTSARESSLRQLLDRVVNTIRDWGLKLGHLKTSETEAFGDELRFLLVNQYASFNSPVWFNVGIKDEPSTGWCYESREDREPVIRKVAPGEHRPQCSACFILSIEDNMPSILNWTATEGMIFKHGSGSGCNISPLRSDHEYLSSGGRPSGPLPFMKINDTAAGSIKSGGKHRRAAKMVIMNVDHPNILDFVRCKAKEEEKVRRLIQAGFPADFNIEGNAYEMVFYQNANHSVRVTNEFMERVLADGAWETIARTKPGSVVEVMKAKDVLHEIAQATWACGDPGMQFDTRCNLWHTCKSSGRLNGSNPCSEFMFLDDSACNLASLNLMKFRGPDGAFATVAFRKAVHTLTIAQDILVDMSSYPTEKIARNSHDFRPLGLGYANLGAYLMSMGRPYDSPEGRDLAAKITALLTGQAYLTSAALAERLGPFDRYKENETSLLNVLAQHREAVKNLRQDGLRSFVDDVWGCAIDHARRTGVRNAQATLLAPTGTIGFMMDCDTTGIEPELALVKHKKLVGGGTMKIVNQTVEQALGHLGYDGASTQNILEKISQTGSVEGSVLGQDHLAIFDTSFPAKPGGRTIAWQGHLKMMAAVQPFLSGAISKTVNMPESATVEDIEEAYIEAWMSGLKAVAIYRDNCKGSQPLTTKAEEKPAVTSGFVQELPAPPVPKVEVTTNAQGSGWQFVKDGPITPVNATKITPNIQKPVRRRMPETRAAKIHKFSIGGHEGYLTVGMFDDGTPGELFIDVAKEGSTLSGFADAFAISVSMGLQYGVPREDLVKKFSNMRFEPSGFAPGLQGYAHSIVDYIFRWLDKEFPTEESLPAPKVEAKTVTATSRIVKPASDAPLCMECGSLMVRNGTCHKCENCGSTSGCS